MLNTVAYTDRGDRTGSERNVANDLAAALLSDTDDEIWNGIFIVEVVVVYGFFFLPLPPPPPLSLSLSVFLSCCVS